MVEDPNRQRATPEDLEELPETVVGEIVDGELYTSPRPATLHARATSRLGSRLVGPFDEGIGGPGGWIILFEPELHLADDIFVPDLAGWRRERMPELPDVVGVTVAPDWLCEVLSPSTAALDRVKKLPKYAARGVGHVWLVDPQVRTLEVYRLESGGWRLVATHAHDAKVRVEPFEALELELAALWAR